ncbi:MAG TPA: right-handed parallel beta-helix repeat-containing protein [Candidatus Binatia bacterium]|nr:right-handed parallel beta-helix repeat-containing protein [Candidatus Binatia bacterium]
MKSPKKLLFTAFVGVGSLSFLFSIADAGTKRVSCSSSKTLNLAIANLKPGDTLLVSGTCNENVVIGSELSRITLDGQGTATINGPNPAANTIVVRGSNITIRGFTITGGSRGIQVSRGAEATIDENTIQFTGGQGIQVFNGSSARILNNTIQNNPEHGIFVVGTSVADIGVTSNDQTVPDTNTIQNNGGDGIQVSRGSSARIMGNVISNNASDGIFVDSNSVADTASNIINSNGDNGINVLRNSSVRLGRDGGMTLTTAPNSTTANNTGNGVRCRINGAVDGQVGTLDGNAGAVSIAGGCTDSTIP